MVKHESIKTLKLIKNNLEAYLYSVHSSVQWRQRVHQWSQSVSRAIFLGAGFHINWLLYQKSKSSTRTWIMRQTLEYALTSMNRDRWTEEYSVYRDKKKQKTIDRPTLIFISLFGQTNFLPFQQTVDIGIMNCKESSIVPILLFYFILPTPESQHQTANSGDAIGYINNNVTTRTFRFARIYSYLVRDMNLWPITFSAHKINITYLVYTALTHHIFGAQN